MRLCKYALNLLLEIFQDSAVAEDMHFNTHEKLTHELLSHLVNIVDLTNRYAMFSWLHSTPRSHSRDML